MADPGHDQRPHLSKSRYIAGRQCARRLWLGWHARERAAPPDPSRTALLAAGIEIGERARLLFPGGVLVDERDHVAAVARTRTLLADAAVPAVFEATVEHEGVRIRADVLERLPGGAFGLREVKSGTRVREVHLDDVALQRWVLEGAGLRLPSVEMIHIDDRYVRGAGAIEWPRLFARRDVTSAVAARLADVPALVRAMHATLAGATAPVVEPSLHCWTPYGCEFWEDCTRSKPDDWILHLPSLRGARLAELRAAGVERIGQIPEEFPLAAFQVRARDAIRSGREFVSPDLAAALAALGPPTDYLDFETMSAALPPYPGTRPYERIPFQWSLHRADADASLTHQAFLADGRLDPRRAFATTLLAAVAGTSTPILVYSPFEDGVLADLAASLPDLADELASVRARLCDLLAVVRAHVYHPGFRDSLSLKRVAPVLVPGFGYDDLDGVAAGGVAAAEFARLAHGRYGTDEEAELRRRLLAYCARDTLALVALHGALRTRAG